MKLADDIEDTKFNQDEASPENSKLKLQDVLRLHDFPILITFTGDSIISIFTMIMNSILNITSNLIMITMISMLLYQGIGIDPNITKLVTFLIFAVIIFIVVEPEKIKPLTIFVCSILVGITIAFSIYFSVNIYTKSYSSTITLFHFENTLRFFGVSTYAFESIGTVVNSRSLIFIS